MGHSHDCYVVSLHFGPDWTSLDQIGPDWTRLDQNWTRIGPELDNWTSLHTGRKSLTDGASEAKLKNRSVMAG
jgi:hypothetical protein